MANPQVFCADCQERTPHTYAVDQNGELVFTCLTGGCPRFIKLPKGMSADDIRAYFDTHAELNVGIVPAEKAAAIEQQNADEADAAVRQAFGL